LFAELFTVPHAGIKKKNFIDRIIVDRIILERISTTNHTGRASRNQKNYRAEAQRTQRKEWPQKGTKTTKKYKRPLVI